MVWTITGIALLFLGAVGVVILVGLALPREHKAAGRILVAGSPQSVWDALTDFENHHTWRPDVKKTERRPDIEGKPAWTEHNSFGTLPMTIKEWQPPSRMVTRIIDKGMPFGGSWTYELSESDGTTVLQITENGVVFNPIFRFVSRFVMGHHATMDTFLKHLAHRFGEAAEPEHVTG